MKIMARHTSVTAPKESPHLNQTTTTTIRDAVRRRAQAVINDRSIDAQSRAIIRYGLETNDPYLAELVSRADAGERIIDTLDFSQTPEPNEDDQTEEKIEALADIICRDGNGPEAKSAALFVLMGTLENSRHPKRLANTAKHFAFNRCGELNLYGMVDAHVAIVEGELLASNGVVLS
jgi:hypothetical protein